MSEDNDFYKLIESKIGCIVPKYVRNILALNGFEDAVNIKTITKEDIKSFEEFARVKMHKYIPKDAKLEDFYGNSWRTPKEFVFLPGHIRLLEEVVIFINKMIASVGPQFFVIQGKENKQKLSSNVPKRGGKSLQLIEPPTSIEIQTTNYQDSNRIINTQGVNGTSTQSGDNVNLVECNQIFSNVASWAQKKVRGVYEQYSRGFHIGMVVLTNEADGGDTEIAKVAASVRCPICASLVPIQRIPKELASGYATHYFVISNFTRHINKHVADWKEAARKNKKKTEKSMMKSRQKRPQNRRRDHQSDNEEPDFTSSDLEENEAIENEMMKNFENDDSNAESSSSTDSDDIIPAVRRRQKLRKIDAHNPESKERSGSPLDASNKSMVNNNIIGDYTMHVVNPSPEDLSVDLRDETKNSSESASNEKKPTGRLGRKKRIITGNIEIAINSRDEQSQICKINIR